MRVIASTGWHGPERHLEQHWRWSGERSELRIINENKFPLLLAIHGSATAAADTRTLRVNLGERMIWSGDLTPDPRELRFGFTALPGETILTFTSNLPARRIGAAALNRLVLRSELGDGGGLRQTVRLVRVQTYVARG